MTSEEIARYAGSRRMRLSAAFQAQHASPPPRSRWQSTAVDDVPVLTSWVDRLDAEEGTTFASVNLNVAADYRPGDRVRLVHVTRGRQRVTGAWPDHQRMWVVTAKRNNDLFLAAVGGPAATRIMCELVP